MCTYEGCGTAARAGGRCRVHEESATQDPKNMGDGVLPRSSDSSSGYVGVQLKTLLEGETRYTALAKIDNESKYIGTYDTALEAARARQAYLAIQGESTARSSVKPAARLGGLQWRSPQSSLRPGRVAGLPSGLHSSGRLAGLPSSGRVAGLPSGLPSSGRLAGLSSSGRLAGLPSELPSSGRLAGLPSELPSPGRLAGLSSSGRLAGLPSAVQYKGPSFKKPEKTERTTCSDIFAAAKEFSCSTPFQPRAEVNPASPRDTSPHDASVGVAAVADRQEKSLGPAEDLLIPDEPVDKTKPAVGSCLKRKRSEVAAVLAPNSSSDDAEERNEDFYTPSEARMLLKGAKLMAADKKGFWAEAVVHKMDHKGLQVKWPKFPKSASTKISFADALTRLSKCGSPEMAHKAFERLHQAESSDDSSDDASVGVAAVADRQEKSLGPAEDLLIPDEPVDKTKPAVGSCLKRKRSEVAAVLAPNSSSDDAEERNEDFYTPSEARMLLKGAKLMAADKKGFWAEAVVHKMDHKGLQVKWPKFPKSASTKISFADALTRLSKCGSPEMAHKAFERLHQAESSDDSSDGSDEDSDEEPQSENVLASAEGVKKGAVTPSGEKNVEESAGTAARRSSRQSKPPELFVATPASGKVAHEEEEEARLQTPARKTRKVSPGKASPSVKVRSDEWEWNTDATDSDASSDESDDTTQLLLSGEEVEGRKEAEEEERDDGAISKESPCKKKKERCSHGKCGNESVSKGLCKRHGGGMRCAHEGCVKAAQGTRELCIQHGGGKQCSHDKCVRAVVSRGLCKRHGGGKRCSQEGCNKAAQGGLELCITHGGAKQCSHSECVKVVVSRGLCREHGGSKPCKYKGCRKVVETEGLCKLHSAT